MADQVIDLIGDDDAQPATPVYQLSPPPPHPLSAVEPSAPANATSAPPPSLRLPALFDDDEEDDNSSICEVQPQDSRAEHNHDLHASVVNLVLSPTSTPPAPTNTHHDAPHDSQDESDEELRELVKEAKRRHVTTPKSSAKTLTASSPKPPVISPLPFRVTEAISASAITSKNPQVSTSAAVVVDNDEDVVAVGEEHIDADDDFINSSLYDGPDVPQTPQVGAHKMQQLLELNQKSSDATAEMDTPIEMNTLLMKHQKQALYWMVGRESDDKPPGHPRGGILADDQGFGKTISTIALLLTERPQKNARHNCRWGNLIVAPTSIIHQWASELKDHILEQFRPRILIYHGANKPKNPKTLTKYDIVITTYGTLSQEFPKVLEKDGYRVLRRRVPGNLFKINWFRVILDEAQAIRNFRRDTFKAVSSLRARRKWSLTGTPIQNTVDDIYSQFLFLGYHVTETYKEWDMQFKRPLEGKHHSKRLFDRFQAILGVVLLRRAKHDRIDGKPVIELPPRNMKVMELTFTRTEKQYYEGQEWRAINRMHHEAGTTGNDFTLALHIILRLRQACGHPALCEWGSGREFNFSDDELDVVEIRMQTKCMFDQLPEAVRARLSQELGPGSSVIQTCPICLDLIESGIVTKCGHLFCTSDYESWHRENDTCPACRAYLGTDGDIMSLDGVRKEIHALERRKKREKAKCHGTEGSEEEGGSVDAMVLGGIQHDSTKPTMPIRVLRLSEDGDSDEETRMRSSGSREAAMDGEKENVGNMALRNSSSTQRKRAPDPRALEEPKKRRRIDHASNSSGDSSDDARSSSSQGDELDTAPEKLKTSTKIKTFMTEFERIYNETDDKVLCFSQWTRMLDMVEKAVNERGHEFVRLDGRMSVMQKEEQVRLFRSRSKCRLFLMSLTAGSTGLNLSVANRVFLLDSWWNPAVENQAIDRVHRIGQQKTVEVIKLKIANTIEERILEIQERKRQIIDGALGVEGLKTFGRQRLTMQDLMGLFSDVADNVAQRADGMQNNSMVARAIEVRDMAMDLARDMARDMAGAV